MNKMIKSLAVTAAVLLSTAAMAADSSYLYWMSSGVKLFNDDWTYAKVAYTTDGGKTVNYLAPSGTGTEFSKDLQWTDNEFYSMRVSIGSLVLNDSYQFALELYNGTQLIASSADSYAAGWLTYAAAYVGGESFAPGEATFAFYQVPEPTSGLLAMLGFGLLALRRKQKKA